MSRMPMPVNSTTGNKEPAPPGRPYILTEIEDLMRKPSLNLRAIAQLVGQDEELSEVFLRIVNSSYYGLQTKIESAEQAIPLLGLQQTLNIVRAESLKRVTGGDHMALAHRRMSERAQGIADLCECIAGFYLPEYISPDLALLAGQFHDCGVAVLMQHYPDYCASLNVHGNHKLPNILEEDLRIGINHCEIGYRLAKDWKLPNRVCLAIRYHHDLSRADEDTRGYVAALQMAMHLYNQRIHQDDWEWGHTRDAVMDELEIAPDGLEEFERSVHEVWRERNGG